jgi:tetratricopeptide (TPR) repeat protein
MADPPYPVLLDRYNADIRNNPQNYLKRSERAAFILNNGDTGGTTREDIDTLLSHAEWRGEGNCLKALRLKLQGHLNEAGVLIQKNLRDGIHVPEQSRLLAAIELSRKDTGAAIAAYRLAWDQSNDENDYINLLGLYRRHGDPPGELLKQGLQLYPLSPGAIQNIFEAHLAAGGKANLEICLKISARAQKNLWPLSLDWKMRHARVLLSLKRPREAEPVLMAALDLLDGDSRLKGGDSQRFRKEIFTLLEAARK